MEKLYYIGECHKCKSFIFKSIETGNNKFSIVKPWYFLKKKKKDMTLLKYDGHTKSCTYLLYITSVLRSVCTHKTITTVKP